MKLEKLSETLYAKLLAQLDQSDTNGHSLERLRSGLTYVQTALAQLKLEVDKNGFASHEEEIYFFKKGKTQIYSLLVFITEQYAIESSMPLIGRQKQLAHLETQLAFINRFFRQNEFFYQYYRFKETELDKKYFTRNAELQFIGFSEVPQVDPTFSTVGDYLFSKFMAYEKLQISLKAEIELKKGGEGKVYKNPARGLKWTGEAVNMVELIYGIFETGQVNDGKVSLSELMDFFGQTFQVNISGYFKRFADIKRRKSMSKTRYLDEMQQKVSKRIEDSDAWIPDDQRSRYGY